MIKVIIADDHAIIRRGIREILEGTDAVRMADEVGNADELIDKLMKKAYDLVLLDINLPGRSGLEALKDIKAIKPDQKVLVLSIYPEEEYAIRAVKSGAAGYLRKDSSPDEIVKAIMSVIRGKSYLSGEVYDALIEDLRNPEPEHPHRRLSNREMEIFVAIGRGRTLSQISEDLHLSPKTISTYRSRILEKTKLKNNAEIMKYVIENKIE